MTPIESQAGNPVEQWVRESCGTGLRWWRPVRLELPGEPLIVRTNSLGYRQYLRDRARCFLSRSKAPARAAASVVCLEGDNWPAVAPPGIPRKTGKHAFASLRGENFVCAWGAPEVMGCVNLRGPLRIDLLGTEVKGSLMARREDEPAFCLMSHGVAFSALTDLLFCLFARRMGFTILHGAVLEREGRGILILGESGAGKTTAALALARGGFRLLTDEYALLWNQGPRRGRCGGLSVPSMLVGEAPRCLDRLEETLGLPGGGAKVPYVPPRRHLAQGSVGLAAVLALASSSAVRPSRHLAARLAPEKLFPLLTRQVLDPVTGDRGRLFDVLLQMAEHVPAYTVRASRDLRSLPAFCASLMNRASLNDDDGD